MNPSFSGNTPNMIKNGTASLATLFSLWLIFRCIFTLWFFKSEYQSYILTFATLTTLLDFFVICKAIKRAEQFHALARQSGKNTLVATRLANLSFLLSIFVPSVCASIISINSLSPTANTATFHGPVSIDQAVELPEGGCFSIPEASVYTRFLGTVQWNEDSSDSGRFFHAAPLESKAWGPDSEVRVWAIVDENELSEGALTRKAYFVNIPNRFIYYDIFRLAVSNAESNSNLKSASDAILVRLVDSPEKVASAIYGNSFWIILAYALIAIPIVAYPFCFALAPTISEQGRKSDVSAETPAPPSTDRTAPYPTKPFSATRSFWFLLHVVGYIPLALILVKTLSIQLAAVFVMIAPLFEMWLLMRAFRNPQTRSSARMAAACLMPIAMTIATILAIATNYRIGEAAIYDSKSILADFESAPADGSFVKVADELIIRNELTGSFWAPDSETKSWRMIPLLNDGWTTDTPIDLWVKSTDILDLRVEKNNLRFFKVMRGTDDFRLSQAISDAESRHGIKSAEDYLVLEPLVDPGRLLSEAKVFVVLGFFLCLLSWVIGSLFWPSDPEVNSLAD